MPRASGSRTGTKHKRKRVQRAAEAAEAGDAEAARRIAALQAAAAKAEAAHQAWMSQQLFGACDLLAKPEKHEEFLPRRPVSKERVCPHCCSLFGRYVKQCEDDDCQRHRRGRSVMVVSEGLAVTCLIKCGGHERTLKWDSYNFCSLNGKLPDIVIDRATVH